MSFLAEHNFKLKNPDLFIKFTRKNDIPEKGISFIYGIRRDNVINIQAIRFNSKIWSFEKASRWIKNHKLYPITSEPVSNQ